MVENKMKRMQKRQEAIELCYAYMIKVKQYIPRFVMLIITYDA